MSDEPLVSYAQNGEDIVLWRALGHVHGGVFVDVGGWDPDEDSVTRLCYERGWRGVDVEPLPDLAERFRERRPRDEVVQAAITDRETSEVVLHRFGSTGLSTVDDELADRHDEAGFERTEVTVPARRLDDVLASSSVVGDAVHFLKIDVEGAEDQVLRSIDLTRWRPWVLVIEATEPNSTAPTHQQWEPQVLAAGYTCTLFDGLSRFYVSAEHPELAADLSYPACPLDRYERSREIELSTQITSLDGELANRGDEVGRLRVEAIRWRHEAVNYWANAMAHAQGAADQATAARGEAERARAQLKKARSSLQKVRTDRRRLRARSRRLAERLTRLEAAPPAQPSTRLRSAARRLMRS